MNPLTTVAVVTLMVMSGNEWQGPLLIAQSAVQTRRDEFDLCFTVLLDLLYPHI
jgi:hypothetical protein